MWNGSIRRWTFWKNTLRTPVLLKRIAWRVSAAASGLPRRGTEDQRGARPVIHDIDLVLTMVKSEIERFDVVGIPVLSKTEDIVNARIKFKNGQLREPDRQPGESGADAPVPGVS